MSGMQPIDLKERTRLSPRSRPHLFGLYPAPHHPRCAWIVGVAIAAPFEVPLSYQQHPVLLGLAVLVPVFAVLASHQQGKAAQSLTRQARVVRVAHSCPIAERPHSRRRPNAHDD